MGLLVVLLFERCRDDTSEGEPLAEGVAPLVVCLDAGTPLFWGLMATGELGWKMPWR